MTERDYMMRCLELAKNGLGTTYPNPLVGSVVVHNGKIIGEGWHQKAGGPHAEVVAINSVADASLLEESTLYVNLEPCSHHGKTPPCADLIVSKKIPRVVIGTADPHEKVAGRGIKRLKEAGIDATWGICEDECHWLNRRFFTFHKLNRPYVVLKWAESADGFIAPAHREKTEPFWISNRFSRQLVHKWRTEEQSILTGTNAVLDDNPMLTARQWEGKNPIRLVIDRKGRIPAAAHVFDGTVQTIAFSEISSFPSNVEAEEINFENTPEEILNRLATRDIQSVLIEGGRITLQSFINAGLWDEARIFRSASMLKSGTRAPELTGTLVSRELVSGDELLIIRR